MENAKRSMNPTVFLNHLGFISEFCVGTSLESIDDIFPCTWIASNTSGRVDIKAGHVYIDNIKGKSLTNYVKPDKKTNMTALNYSINSFEMEPGRNFFTKMKICNEAYTCLYKFVGSTTVTHSANRILANGANNGIDALTTVKYSVLPSYGGKKFITVQNKTLTNTVKSLIFALILYHVFVILRLCKTLKCVFTL
jgi:hypothetical protein